MEKIFNAEYGNDLYDDIRLSVKEYIFKETINEDGSCKVFNPSAVVIIKLYNQNGELIKS